jgi:putative transposase
VPRRGRRRRRKGGRRVHDWVEYTPNSIWIYDTTHFTAAGMAVLIIEDLVSRKWITEIVSVEETSTQVELAFTDALQAEGLLEQVDAPTTAGSTSASLTRPARSCSPSATTGRR